MAIAKHITLIEETHTYVGADGKIYDPVSKILGRYKEPFDGPAIAAKQSRKTGRSVEDILAEWAKSAPYGTAVHKQIENYFMERRANTDLIRPYLPIFDKRKAQDCIFHPEVILSIEDLAIAGTADMLVECADGSWSILDWKTNHTIYKNGFKGQKLKSPLDHLDDCNWIHYSLQLSFYAVMLETAIAKMNLIHIPKDQERLEVIPCLDLRREVEMILEQMYFDVVSCQLKTNATKLPPITWF